MASERANERTSQHAVALAPLAIDQSRRAIVGKIVFFQTGMFVVIIIILIAMMISISFVSLQIKKSKQELGSGSGLLKISWPGFFWLPTVAAWNRIEKQK